MCLVPRANPHRVSSVGVQRRTTPFAEENRKYRNKNGEQIAILSDLSPRGKAGRFRQHHIEQATHRTRGSNSSTPQRPILKGNTYPTN